MQRLPRRAHRDRRSRRRPGAAGCLLIVCSLSSFGATERAGAQSEAPIVIQLVAQDATTLLGDTADLRLRITGAIPAFGDLEIRVVAGQRITTLEQLAASADATELAVFNDAVELPLAFLPRFVNGDVVAPVALQPLDAPTDFSKLQIGRAGVYPIQILVRDRDEHELAQTMSWLVVSDASTSPTVRVTSIWRFEPPPSVELDGITPTEDFIDRAGPTGPFAQFVERVAAAPFPVSLVVSPQWLEAWSNAAGRDPDVAAAFERAQAVLRPDRLELLAVPYVPIDAPDLERRGLGTRVPASYRLGAERLQQILGRRPNPTTVLATPIDRASLARLGDVFAYQAVIPAAALGDGSGLVATQADRGFTFAGIDALRAHATRAEMAALLAGPRDTRGRNLQRLVATFALMGTPTDEGSEAAPASRPPVPVVFAPAAVPSATLLDDLGDALVDNPFVELAPASELFDEFPTDAPQAIPPDAPDPPSTGSRPIGPFEIGRTARTLDAFVGFVGDDHAEVSAARANLDLVLSRDLSADEVRRRLAQIDAAASQFLSGIGTESKGVTLTDRRSEIPLSFRNDTDRDVTVRVTLESSKLSFPDGNTKTIVLPAGRNTQEGFEVEARASGTFTMRVSISSADGNLAVGAPAVITVRSAVFGSVGTFVTLGAVAFLALWWAHHLWRTRRRRRAGTPLAAGAPSA